MKKICVTKLFTSSQLLRFTHVREEERTKLLKSLIERSAAGEPCDLSKELEALTSLMIYRMTMGNRSSSLSSSEDYNYSVEAMEMRGLIRNIMECGKKYAVIEVFGPLRRFDLFGNGKRIEKAFLRYDQRLEQIIHEYEENRMNNIIDGENEEKDVMDILLETCRDSSAEVTITKSHIKYFFMEIFMASVDSTSTAMQSAMAELINRPEIFKKLREEINSVVGSNQLVKESDVPNLPYLQAVLKETLRLHPPGPMLRRTATVDSKINGYDIKAGTKMFVNCYAIMRDPNVWKDPEKFMPERFLDCCDRVMDFKGQDFGYLPFGSGRRACFGAPHAAYVIHATVAALVQCFDWKLEDGDKAGIDIVSGYTGAMAHPLVCYPSVHGNLLPSPNPVIECYVYGDSRPWKRLFEGCEEKSLYFFTRLKNKNDEKDKRINRVTDSGTWRAQSDKEVFSYGDQTVLIGFKRSFSFMPKTSGQESRGIWPYG
ncbi:hypothetical protein LWI28_016372 [Acer negundo]|uniref:NAC domain-containing protein n=1 Tax=Acer negundo TaxID=4023 RepID=A0AAD5IFH1_ACENE|nr:hypothetical protein LWI28_016372 [Acer negundo]